MDRKKLLISGIIILLVISNTYLILGTRHESNAFTMNTIVKVYVNDKLVYQKTGDMFNINMEYWIEWLFNNNNDPPSTMLYDTSGTSHTLYGIKYDSWGFGDNATERRKIYAITDSGWNPDINTKTLPAGSILLDAESEYGTEASGNTITIKIIKYKMFEDPATIYGSILATKIRTYKDTSGTWDTVDFILCVDKFSSSVSVNSGDVLKIEYDIVINP